MTSTTVIVPHPDQVQTQMEPCSGEVKLLQETPASPVAYVQHFSKIILKTFPLALHHSTVGAANAKGSSDEVDPFWD